VGDLLDFAVIALAGMVCVSLALLAWTLGVSIPLAVRRFRIELVVARLTLARAERRLQSAADDVRRRSRPAGAGSGGAAAS
jgi:hypothetical protein